MQVWQAQLLLLLREMPTVTVVLTHLLPINRILQVEIKIQELFLTTLQVSYKTATIRESSQDFQGLKRENQGLITERMLLKT